MQIKFAIAAALALAGAGLPTVAPAQPYGGSHYDHHDARRGGYNNGHDRRAFRERQRRQRQLREMRRHRHDRGYHYGR